ncbi:hypothetical protein ABN763_06195 [Spongiivirga sp. MCCC 1A20706]|uniref:hypothetical protein n=1 Tax=Spongiivirga sp. MCCC 1A20706 TaxID=3160963 RepID=UPI003977A8E0
MKSAFKILLTSLTLLIILNGCSDETVEVSPDNLRFEFSVKKGNLTNFTSYSDDLKTGVSPFAKSLKEKSNNSTSRDTYSELYDFYLDTTNVQLIDNGYLKSYAMPIVREHWENGFLENYIITFYQDGSHTQWIVKYKYDNSYPNGFDMQKTEITVIDDPNLLSFGTSRGDCPPHLVEYSWDDNAGDCIEFDCTYGGEHPYGDNNCDVSPGHPDAARRVCFGAWVVSGCAQTGGGSNGGQDPTSGSGAGSGGGIGGDGDPDEFCMEDCPPVIPIRGPVATPCNTPGGSGFVNADGECVVPDQILKDSSFENSKADCVYEKLKANSSGFAGAIRNFDGDFPVAHLKFTIDNSLPNTTNAQTSVPSQFLIQISINGNTLSNRTVLGLARTLIHETIHAEMYRKVKSVNNQISITDFPGIYDYYTRHIKNWQHQQMANHYIDVIADMLQMFDGNSKPRQYYEDISWVGLYKIRDQNNPGPDSNPNYINTDGWNALTVSEQQRILNTIATEKLNGNKNCTP